MHTDESCVFCKIAAKEIPSRIADESENVVAFYDLNPMAPTHILVIPKEHLASLRDISENNANLVGEMALMAKRLATSLGLEVSGYRVVMNTGKDAGQTVFHLHMHLLGGRAMGWPPG